MVRRLCYASLKDQVTGRSYACAKTRILADVSTLWICKAGDDALRCLSVLLRMHTLQHAAAPAARRLLRVLLLRLHTVSIAAGSHGIGYNGTPPLLSVLPDGYVTRIRMTHVDVATQRRSRLIRNDLGFHRADERE